MVVVLDDVTDLADAKFAGYFVSDGSSTSLHRALRHLSSELQLLHRIPRCFVFCTGRSLWLSSKALVRSGSPLLMQPTLLQPLTTCDIVDALYATRDDETRILLRDACGIAAHMTEVFAARVQAVTGGVARAVQHLLRARQRECTDAVPILQSNEDVDSASERLAPRVDQIPGLLLRIKWDGPAEAVEEREVPAWMGQQENQLKLVQLFAQMLLLDTPFHPAYVIPIGTQSVRLSDAAVVLGLSYGPCESQPSSAVNVRDSSVSSGCTYLRLIAGEWLCRSLLHERAIIGRPALLASVQLLATMRAFGGTMRGRPFEMLCADALCFRSMVMQEQPLSRALAHLSQSLRGEDLIPSLRVVALPKAVADGRLPRISDDAKRSLLLSREKWGGAKVINAADLPWLLGEWLPSGILGVPADAQSGSQNIFLRLSGGVVGFALKAASRATGTQWSDIRDELRKAPVLPPEHPYTLVLWSLNLAPQVRAAVGTADAAVYRRGAWRLEATRLVQAVASGVVAGPGFDVVTPAELVVANPHAPGGGGLGELLGGAMMAVLNAMSDGTQSKGLSIEHLADWMPRAEFHGSAEASHDM